MSLNRSPSRKPADSSCPGDHIPLKTALTDGRLARPDERIFIILAVTAISLPEPPSIHSAPSRLYESVSRIEVKRTTRPTSAGEFDQ